MSRPKRSQQRNPGVLQLISCDCPDLYFLLLTQRQLEESIKCALLEDGDTTNLKEKILYLYSVTIEANRILGVFD